MRPHINPALLMFLQISVTEDSANQQLAADSLSTIQRVEIVAGLQKSVQQTLALDKGNILLASMGYDPVTKAPIDKSAIPGYMQAYQTYYQNDSTIGDAKVQFFQSDLENMKQQVTADGKVESKTYDLAQPFLQLSKLIMQLITSLKFIGKSS